MQPPKWPQCHKIHNIIPLFRSLPILLGVKAKVLTMAYREGPPWTARWTPPPLDLTSAALSFVYSDQSPSLLYWFLDRLGMLPLRTFVLCVPSAWKATPPDTCLVHPRELHLATGFKVVRSLLFHVFCSSYMIYLSPSTHLYFRGFLASFLLCSLN